MNEQINHRDALMAALAYNPDTGVFTWKVSNSPRVKVGDVAGCKQGRGDRGIHVLGKKYKAHRLAWLFVNGHWPKNHIDHIDGNPLNNAFCNLRQASHQQNCQNQKRFCTNTSGVTGVSYQKNIGKWFAYIWVNSKRLHLGYFDKLEEAAEVRRVAKAVHHAFNPVQRVI